MMNRQRPYAHRPHRLVAGRCQCGGADDCPWKNTSFAGTDHGMKLFYVTFGSGTVFGGYHAAFEAHDESIVRAFMNKHYRGVWSSIYIHEPVTSNKRLNERPVVLAYSRWEDV